MPERKRAGTRAITESERTQSPTRKQGSGKPAPEGAGGSTLPTTALVARPHRLLSPHGSDLYALCIRRSVSVEAIDRTYLRPLRRICACCQRFDSRCLQSFSVIYSCLFVRAHTTLVHSVSNSRATFSNARYTCNAARIGSAALQVCPFARAAHGKRFSSTPPFHTRLLVVIESLFMSVYLRRSTPAYLISSCLLQFILLPKPLTLLRMTLLCCYRIHCFALRAKL